MSYYLHSFHPLDCSNKGFTQLNLKLLPSVGTEYLLPEIKELFVVKISGQVAGDYH